MFAAYSHFSMGEEAWDRGPVFFRSSLKAPVRRRLLTVCCFLPHLSRR